MGAGSLLGAAIGASIVVRATKNLTTTKRRKKKKAQKAIGNIPF